MNTKNKNNSQNLFKWGMKKIYKMTQAKTLSLGGFMQVRSERTGRQLIWLGRPAGDGGRGCRCSNWALLLALGGGRCLAMLGWGGGGSASGRSAPCGRCPLPSARSFPLCGCLARCLAVAHGPESMTWGTVSRDYYATQN